VLLSEGPLDHLDHSPTLQFVGGKIGIDATAKSPAEGAREWPEEIEMSAEVKELVDRRWSEYGLASPPLAPPSEMRQSSRRLLRR
jgi:4-hydroxy-3-polyprenylbenzoate decarboxylase